MMPWQTQSWQQCVKLLEQSIDSWLSCRTPATMPWQIQSCGQCRKLPPRAWWAGTQLWMTPAWCGPESRSSSWAGLPSWRWGRLHVCALICLCGTDQKLCPAEAPDNVKMVVRVA